MSTCSTSHVGFPHTLAGQSDANLVAWHQPDSRVLYNAHRMLQDTQCAFVKTFGDEHSKTVKGGDPVTYKIAELLPADDAAGSGGSSGSAAASSSSSSGGSKPSRPSRPSKPSKRVR
jgi:hypothetical protein